MDHISAEKLKKDIDARKEITVVNVMDKESFQDCRIPSSINIPYKGDMHKAVEGWDEDSYIVVYCASQECNASKEAFKKLSAMGFSNVYRYAGGMQEWKEKGYPTEGACKKG